MTYSEILKDFASQCRYEPEVINKEKIKPYRRIVVVGMGGSRLGPDFLKICHPELDISVHSDFGLPALSAEELSQALIIANSHSGATAETLDAAQTAFDRKLNLAVVDSGGPLQEFAERHHLPNVHTPDHDLAPRLTVGYNLAALMALLGLDRKELAACGTQDVESQGRKLGQALMGKIPLVYAPNRYLGLAYAWKIIFNETAKVPAFCNRFPELDHNEIAGFDASSRDLFQAMHVVMLRDDSDKRIAEKMTAVSSIVEGNGVMVSNLDLQGANTTEHLMTAFLTAHWAALTIAENKKVEALAVPSIEALKKMS